jgi:type IV pilus biogenesis protein CpaD/CtpE
MKVIPMRALELFGVIAVMALSGCSNYPSSIDDNFGSSVRQMVVTQIANPDATRLASETVQSDGQSAKSAVDRYQKSFEVIPPPTNVFNIGVGSGSAGTAR